MRKFVTAALGTAAVLGAAAALVASPAVAQDQARMEMKTFHAPSIAGNLEGNDANRGAYVITPPGYDENADRRYPVVYFLHGYWGTPQAYDGMVNFQDAVQGAAEAGNEVILVVPDGNSKLKGGFYSSSPTVGDYEAFVAEDLVAWVDGNYRTIAARESRGLAGHSMGGYGTIRVGMKHPDVFSSLYMMSACCLDPMEISAEQAATIEAMMPEDVANADFGGLAAISTLATWSPDPSDSGFLKIFTGLREDGTLDPLVNQRLAANSPVVLLPQYVGALTSLEAFAMDIGDKDFLLEGNRLFREELDRFGVSYQFELYEGDHISGVGAQMRSDVLPFFGEHLDRQ